MMSRQLRYYHRDPATRNAATKACRAKPSGRASVLLSSCRRRARNKGLEFDLTKEWIQAKLETECELSGESFDFHANARGLRTPSVDRIDNSKGYTKDNCRVILWGLNAAFGTWGDAEFREIARAWLGETKPEPKIVFKVA